MDTPKFYFFVEHRKDERKGKAVAVAENELHSNKKKKGSVRCDCVSKVLRRSPHFAIFECVRK